MNIYDMTSKDFEKELRRIIADELDIKIRSVIHSRLDKMQESLDKLETIDRIITDIKSLFVSK